MSIQYWKRKYELQLLTTSGDELFTLSSSQFSKPLRMAFDVRKVAWQQLWEGEVSVYNLNTATEIKLASDGGELRLSAGYEDGPYGEIFRAQVFQVLYSRPGNVDQELRFRCIVNLLGDNFISTTTGPQMTQRDVVLRMLEQCNAPVQVRNLADKLGVTVLPRGRVLFGDPRSYLSALSNQHNLAWWQSMDGVTMQDTLTAPTDPDYVYGPRLATGQKSSGVSHSLIGTPRQTQDGVDFTVELDPRIEIGAVRPTVVKLDHALIEQAAMQVGSLPPFMSPDGCYNVVGVRHYGDTRANDWRTDITGVTSAYGRLGTLTAGVIDLSGGTLQ